jgi:hypothetical protein
MAAFPFLQHRHNGGSQQGPGSKELRQETATQPAHPPTPHICLPAAPPSMQQGCEPRA